MVKEMFRGVVSLRLFCCITKEYLYKLMKYIYIYILLWIRLDALFVIKQKNTSLLQASNPINFYYLDYPEIKNTEYKNSKKNYK